MEPDDAAKLSATKPLMDAGLDSLTAPTFAKKLGAAVGLSLRPTLLFEHSTAVAVAEHLLRFCQQRAPGHVYHNGADIAPCSALLSGGLVGSGASVRVSTTTSTSKFARLNRTAADDAFEVASDERWSALQPIWAGGRDAWAMARHCSFVRGADLFDHQHFGISAAEARSTDPQQRLLLEAGYEALHAKVRQPGSSEERVGVMVGLQSVDFIFMNWTALEARPPPVFAATVLQSVASGRLSFVLGLTGACYSIDSACSASLVAVDLAGLAIHDKQCESAIALGVNLMLLPAMSFMLANARMLSVDGRCKTFDARANGYVRAEAVGALAVYPKLMEDLATLEDVNLRCERRFTAVDLRVCGSSVRQDGKSASLTAPNGSAQVELLREVGRKTGVRPSEIGLAESHGTGTALGDPTEMGSLVGASLAAHKEAPLAVGGVKANIGHAEPAAGMTGLFKLALGLRAGEVTSNAQLRVLNPYVGLALPREACALAAAHLGAPASRRDVGCVSSFGYSGTIAHALGSSDSRTERLAPPSLPPVHFRRAFPWRDHPHPFACHLHVPTSKGVTAFLSQTERFRHLINEHVVQGRVLFPAAGHLEMARAAATGSALRGVFFLQPLAVEAAEMLVECTVADGRFEVRSTTRNTPADAAVHCSGALFISSGWQRVEHVSLRARSCARSACVDALYDGFDAVGLQYGPGYRTLVRAWGGASDAVAWLRARTTHKGTAVNLADLDNALFVGEEIASSGGGEMRLPFAVDGAQLQGACGELWAVSRLCHVSTARVPLAQLRCNCDRPCVPLTLTRWLPTASCVLALAGGGERACRCGVGATRHARRASPGAARRPQAACSHCGSGSSEQGAALALRSRMVAHARAVLALSRGSPSPPDWQPTAGTVVAWVWHSTTKGRRSPRCPRRCCIRWQTLACHRIRCYSTRPHRLRMRFVGVARHRHRPACAASNDSGCCAAVDLHGEHTAYLEREAGDDR